MILLDTHALLWLTEDHVRLGKKARDLVREAEGTSHVAVSAISFWEIGMLIEKQRIALSVTLTDYARNLIEKNGIRIVPVDTKVAVESGSLPGSLHGDPGDRLIAATARLLALPLLTSDSKLLDYSAAGHLQAIDARL
jgi:PIN domain nuclease of toxin-antitoxin system